MVEKSIQKELDRKYANFHNGRVSLRVDHGSKNSNGKRAEKLEKKPKTPVLPSDYDIYQGIEDYFANK